MPRNFWTLTIDRNLSWKSHIDIANKKNCSNAYALYTLSRVINTDAILAAYYGLVESTLKYGVIFWGNSTDRNIIFKGQKRCLISMFLLKRTERCVPFFKQYKILTLPSLYILEVVIFVKSNPNLFPRLDDAVVRNRRYKTTIAFIKDCTYGQEYLLHGSYNL